jgi:hypothetical protein
MKNLTFRLAFITVCTTVLIACAKNEQLSPQSKTTAMGTKSNLNIPDSTINNTGQYFMSIDTICPSYLHFTNRIDISKLTEGDYTQLSDGKLTIDISGGTGHLTKRNATTTEWWKNWNVPPFVESSNPEILSLGDRQALTLKLSKKCYVFGFELGTLITRDAPPYYNLTKDFRAYYYNQEVTPDPVIGIVSRKIAWPGGANLIAIKSDTPFDQVIISFGQGDLAKPIEYAITNIRYVTDKQIYDAHKGD